MSTTAPPAPRPTTAESAAPGFARVVRAFEERYRDYFAGKEQVPFALRSGGSAHVLGPGEPRFAIVVNNAKGVEALATLDVTAAAAAYLAGDVDVHGDILTLITVRDFWTDRRPLRYLWRFVQPLLFGQVRSDKKWIAQHYDYEQDFYLLWLDTRHRCYSQGIFERDDEPLEDAMTRKLDFAIRAVGARAEQRVLDIGGGWGAFTQHAGRQGIRVTSLTISKESERFLNALIEREKLPCRVLREHLFEHQPAERYDAIVNLGVTEHLPDYAATLKKYESLLKPGGKVYLDASSTRRRGGHTTFLEKYVYPGNGSLMCLHEYLAEVARSPFLLEGVWDDRISYHLTTRRWAEALDRNREEIERRWGKQLHRTFQLYLWGSSDGFLRDRNQAYRVVLGTPG